MKSLYNIVNCYGVHLCYQVGRSEQDALGFARMYGHRSARRAVFVREAD